MVLLLRCKIKSGNTFGITRQRSCVSEFQDTLIFPVFFPNFRPLNLRVFAFSLFAFLYLLFFAFRFFVQNRKTKSKPQKFESKFQKKNMKICDIKCFKNIL